MIHEYIYILIGKYTELIVVNVPDSHNITGFMQGPQVLLYYQYISEPRNIEQTLLDGIMVSAAGNQYDMLLDFESFGSRSFGITEK